MSVSPNFFTACLLGLYVWDYLDGREAGGYARKYQPFPLPPPNQARYSASDVSIIVPTVDWDDDLARNLGTWITTRPREVIFVTVRNLAHKLQSTLESAPGLWEVMRTSQTEIKVVTVEQANKRSQLCRGINEAEGKIVALVDDDAQFTTVQVLTELLAPFQNDDVGIVGGPIGSYVPEDRQNSSAITPWEVAALRIRSRRAPGMKAFFVADQSTNFTVSGLTMLLRAEIVKDPYFQHLFTHDMWNGIRQNTGDDGFITRYVLFQHLLPHRDKSLVQPKQWRLGMQLTPEAEVLTSLMTDNRFAHQSRRWYRSGLRLRLTCLLYEPGYYAMKATAPYMTRKMAGGMVNPILTIIRALLWCHLWYTKPWLALILILYVLYKWFTSLLSFYRQFPYCGSKIWAAMIADNLYLISDWYSWATLPRETWSNRATVGKAVENVL
ncbi:glycosyltransferase family 2 protein [Hypomontagnella submonticulosa]|nr:glycosyltransferase family 2 protein [Hypomontagnella submonticulosa]